MFTQFGKELGREVGIVVWGSSLCQRSVCRGSLCLESSTGGGTRGSNRDFGCLRSTGKRDRQDKRDRRELRVKRESMNGVLLSNWFLIRRCDSHASTFRYDPIRLIELFYILLLIPFFYFYSLVTTSYHAITRFAKELISFQETAIPTFLGSSNFLLV